MNNKDIARRLVALAETLASEEPRKRVAKKLSYRDIFKLAKKVSGGYGFWGHHNLLDHLDRDDLIRAWVDALRSKGYEDIDIILYGDWRDGRHIADYIGEDTDYAEFKDIVKKNARNPRQVAQGREDYDADIIEMLENATR